MERKEKTRKARKDKTRIGWGGAVEFEPISETGVSTPWGAVSIPENSVIFHGLYKFQIYGMTPRPGMESYRLRVELAL